MDVVCHPANLNHLHFVLSGNAADEWPKTVGQFRGDDWFSFFGTENAMVIGTDVGHADIQPSLRDLHNLKLNPALKRRAIFNCPYGTEVRAALPHNCRVRCADRNMLWHGPHSGPYWFVYALMSGIVHRFMPSQSRGHATHHRTNKGG